jgi:hypothetical protein
LRERSIASVANWNIEILQAAAAAQRSTIKQIPPADLGEIDRHEHKDAIESALLAAGKVRAPGVCFALHGKEDSGQFAFVAYLEQLNPWEISAQPHRVTPPHDQFDVGSLTASALGELAPAGAAQTATLEQLASVLAERCRTEPVVMILGQLDRFAGGVEVFRAGFWQPLLAAVRALGTPAAHPFIVILMLTATMTETDGEGTTSQPAAAADFEKIVVLPELGKFTQKSVKDWLRDRNVPLAESDAIATRVIGDGIPRGVFDRLNTDGFWDRIPR